MNQTVTTQADRVLDAIQPSQFRALLDGAEAPVDGFSLLALLDLAGDQQHALGESLSGPSVESVARDVFAAGDGEELKRLLQQGVAEERLLGLYIAGQLVLLLPGDETHAVAVRLRGRIDIAQLQSIYSQLQARVASADAAALLSEFELVQWVLRLNLRTGAIVESHLRPNASRTVQDQLKWLREQKLGCLMASLLADNVSPVADKALLQGVVIKVANRFLEMRRLPFVSRLVVALEMQGTGEAHPLGVSLNKVAEDILRDVIGLVLRTGLKTMTAPFPQTDKEFEAILDELRELPKQDLDQRLILGGFADHEIDGRDGVMRCRECIYFLPHRRWCDLPELPVPVEAGWYCRLWKL